VTELKLEQRKKGKPWVAVVVCGIVLALIAWGLHTLMGSKAGNKPRQPKISLMTPPPPPPPPPPPKFEKKIEPPKDLKEVKVEQQVQKAEPPAPTPELKMEGAAGDGPSAFSSGKITSEDLSKMGNGKGELGGLNFNNYSIMLKSELQRYLSKDSNLRHRQYRVEVHVWLAADGSLKKSELINGTGDEATDDEIRQALASTPRFREAPPANMPQPIRLRIASVGR